MEYFNVESFLLSLAEELAGKYKLEKRSKEGEPVKYKITGTPENFVFLTLLDRKGKVYIDLDFSIYSEYKFINEISNLVNKTNKHNKG